MKPINLSKRTTRRFVLGRQGLWPGRRWAGKSGTEQAIRAIEAVQMDPLNVVARSHEIVLWSRVLDYHPEHLEQLIYRERRFFDYGGGLFFYPMEELPYWQIPMERSVQSGRWANFAASHPELLEQVRALLRVRGPLCNREIAGNERVVSYRGRKDTALAFFYLWLSGELMIHHRKGFERIYDFRENVAPPQFCHPASNDEVAEFFARKAIALQGLARENTWKNSLSGFIERRLSNPESHDWLERLQAQEVVTRVRIEGLKEPYFLLTEDLPLIQTIEEGQIPPSWQPLESTTLDEAVFLAPLDIVSARGRASWLFDFEYVWEVYKPAAQRRWGYYTLPVLFGDQLVARIDPRLDRKSKTLVINGFWVEEPATLDNPAFIKAFSNGLSHFMEFLGARQIKLEALATSNFREQLTTHLIASCG